MRRRVSLSADVALLLLATCTVGGCSALTGFGDLVFDGVRDSGEEEDAGRTPDTGPIDEAGRDAGDLGTRDAGDAGPARDAGDMGALDAGDSGPRDAGDDAGDDDAGTCSRDEDCPILDPCSVGTCVEGACSVTATTESVPCDDENACTVDDACVEGACVGVERVCDPSDDCHVGVCNSASGACVQMRAPEGTACDDGDGCTDASTCTSTGVCTGARCAEDDPCRSSVCNTGTETCELMPETNGRPCVGGICCDGACVDTSTDARNCNGCGNSCDGMSGASCIDGHCASCTTSDECNDMLDCTMDRCEAMQCRNALASGSCLIGGRCVGSGEVNPEDPCERCDPTRNPMGWSTAGTGTACDDGQTCTLGDRCTAAGLCVGSPVMCPRSTCAAGVCREAEGGCILVPQNEGGRCGIGVCCSGGSCSMLCL